MNIDLFVYVWLSIVLCGLFSLLLIYVFINVFFVYFIFMYFILLDKKVNKNLVIGYYGSRLINKFI